MSAERIAGLVGLVALLIHQPITAADAERGRLRGEVRADNPPRRVAGVPVFAVTSGARPVLAMSVTDARGYLAFDELPAGTYRVIAWSAELGTAQSSALEVGGPFRAVADLSLAPAPLTPLRIRVEGGQAAENRIQARVVDADGRPVPGVLLRFEATGQRGNPAEDRSDETGRMVMSTLASGVWRLSVHRAGWTPLSIPQLDWSGGTLEILIRLLPAVTSSSTDLEGLLPPARFVK